MKYVNSLAVLVAVGAAVSASAGFAVNDVVDLTVPVSGLPSAVQGDVKVSVNLTGATVRAGDFDVTTGFNYTKNVAGTPVSFQAFCVDLGSVVVIGKGKYSYQQAQWGGEPTPPPWAGTVSGSTAEQRAGWLAQNLYGGFSVSVPATANSSLQLAIWEALYETSGTFGLGSGTFQATSSSAVTIADADTMLGGLPGGLSYELANFPGNVAAIVPSLFYPIDANGRPLANQVLIATEFLGVPEPSTYAMAFAGLLGAFAIGRRVVKK